MIAGDGFGGFAAFAGFSHQGALAGEDAEDVFALGVAGEVAGGVAEDEADFLVEGAGFEFGSIHGGVGGADEDFAVPGDDEEDAAVVGVGDHDGGVALEEVAVEDEVDALAGLDGAGGGGFVHEADLVGEDAGGVDDDAGLEFVGFAGLVVDGGDAIDHDAVLGDAGDADVVEEDGAVVGGGLGEGDGEAGVVELAVEVLDAAEEFLGFDIGDAGEGGVAGEDLGGGEIEAAGEGVVDFQADAEEGAFPPLVAGDDEGEVVDDLGGVAVEEAALAEGFQDEGDVALFEITDAAVDELGTAAGGALGEVVGFEQERAQAAGGGIDGDTEAGGSAADDDDVPGGFLFQAGEEGGAVHRVSQF